MNWRIRVSLYDEWFYMWIEADTVEKVGVGSLLIDGRKTIKIQGTIEEIVRD